MKKNLMKKIASISIFSLFSIQMMYLVIEPTVVTAVTDDVVVTLNVTSGISITDGDPETMEPDIGLASNKAVGTSAWTVRTSSATGYTLAVKALTSPALENGVIDSFADYTETVGGTPEIWSVASGAKEFGFSGYGDDVLASFYDGSQPTNCGNTGTGAPNALSKYLGFETGDQNLASGSVATGFSGVLTTICFAAEQNNVYAASGTYTATITGTALTQ